MLTLEMIQCRIASAQNQNAQVLLVGFSIRVLQIKWPKSYLAGGKSADNKCIVALQFIHIHTNTQIYMYIYNFEMCKIIQSNEHVHISLMSFFKL